ncbi:Qat anti-phage system TatD family nuclease QatD [Chryseobacterium sp. MFBS3-17]|uniref:Qat anti-phage system TatD family nuclease QatD n=1 Tax=Chryseobacterium sp. MFBS3-17 TaxID=2886689 RepID=UPI001D0E10AB|nr:Qat anti-phage system TatD family nuclease QatD [Chryseobacterium sp. MFBS3-17]MCC2590319.1 TatD family hydrolase [Chryseobacterium sp. MFBS3-17]
MLDTHCHIDLYKNPKAILDICENNGITVFSMTNLPSHFEMGFPFFQSKKYLRIALGMHPLYATQHNNEFSKFELNLSKTSYIGEIGLDFSREGIVTKNLQYASFNRILKLVSDKKKILSLHSRKAEKEVLELLMKYKIQSAIFHWYSGSLGLIREISEAGYFFSINSAMIKSVSGKKIISKIPKHLVLPETDGPFISVGGRTVMPGDVDDVLVYLSNIWEISFDETRMLMKSNFRNLTNTLK